MRFCNCSIYALALVFGAIVSGNATAEFSPVEFFRFAGFDSAMVTSALGQDFVDIFGTVDVNVKATLAPTGFAKSVSVDGKTINTGHMTYTGVSNSLVFTFSEPLRIVTQFLTVDRQETVTIEGDGPEFFSAVFGALPMISPFGNGVQIMGTSAGISATGASNGQILNGPTATLTVTHIPKPGSNNKFEYFKIGTLVPEPASLGVVGTGLAALALLRRRRYKLTK